MISAAKYSLSSTAGWFVVMWHLRRSLQNAPSLAVLRTGWSSGDSAGVPAPGTGRAVSSLPAQTTLGSHEHEHRGCLWGFSPSGRLQRTSGSTAAAPVSDTHSPSVHQSSPAGTEHTCATSPNAPAQRAAPKAIHRL